MSLFAALQDLLGAEYVLSSAQAEVFLRDRHGRYVG